MKELGPHDNPPIVRPANTLDELAKVIHAELKGMEEAGRLTLERAKAAGEFLRRAKFQIPHGKFMAWLKENGINYRWASRCMRIAAEWVNFKLDSVSNLAEALRVLTETVDETEDAPPALDSTDWRSLPLREFLKAPDYVWEAFDALKVTTAGELWAKLRDRQTLGMMGGDAGEVKKQLEALDGFTPPASEGRAKRYKPGRGSKEGSDLFDWRGFDGRFGKIVRDIDRVARNYEVKTDPRIEGARRLLGEFVKLWSAVKKDLTGGKK